MNQSTITGVVERIVFESPSSSFVVAKLTPVGRTRSVQAVGGLKGITPGEMVELHGAWDNDPKFGRQFRAESYKSRRKAS